jgi:hypothetical protein
MRTGDRKLLRVFAVIAPLSLVWVGCEGQPERTFFDDSEGGTMGEASVDAPGVRSDATDDVSSPDAPGEDSSSGGGPETGLADDSGGDGSADDGSVSDGSPTDGRANDGSAGDGATMDSGGTGGSDSGKDSGGCVMNACGVCGGATCATSTCCTVTAGNPSGCQIAHNGGYGVTYYDCEATGTDDVQAALDACTAYTGNAADCPSFGCKGDPQAGIVCSQGSLSQLCLCWGFKGDVKGYVDNGGQPPGTNGVNCFCPDPTADPKWN